ncbi:hypothetical protein GCM10018966_078250 [Streptomyces yanii]
MARRWDVPDSVGEALMLIVSELAGNAVRHSGSPDVALLLCVGDGDDGAMVVQVKDTGRWRQPSAAPCAVAAEVDVDVEGMVCGGRRLPLVAAYASGYAVWPTKAGTCVMAELPLAENEPVALAARNRPESRLNPAGTPWAGPRPVSHAPPCITPEPRHRTPFAAAFRRGLT